MSFLVSYEPEGLSAHRYNEALARLERAGLGSPPSRLYHFCFGEPAELRVVDVWESERDSHAFYVSLVPILHDLQVRLPEPEISRVYRTVTGRPEDGSKTPLIFMIDPPHLTATVYDDIMCVLEKAGHGSLPGRRYHVCYWRGVDTLQVFEVWDSVTALRDAYRVMRPILVEFGIPLVEPRAADVYNIIEG